MQSGDAVTVRTSENVVIAYEVAGVASRLLAFLVDGVLSGILVFAAILAWEALISAGDGGGGARSVSVTIGLVATALLTLLAFFGYFVVLEATGSGRTPGKRAMGIRVVRTDGAAIGLSESLVRNLLRIVDVFAAGIGLFVMFFQPQGRRLGDLLAGTMVVRERTPSLTLAAVTAPVMVRTPDAGPPVDGVDRLGATDLEVIRAFLTRAGLTPELRGRMAAQLAARLCDKLELPPSAPERMWPPELLLERLYLQVSARAGLAR